MKDTFYVGGRKALRLDPERISEIEQRLGNVFEGQQRFTLPRYSLSRLSRETGFSRNQLSAYFNQVMGLHFNDYINRLRVSYFKHLIESSEAHQYTLAGLAEKCGFYNRNTFTAAFKKFVGMSPSYYMRHNVLPAADLN